MSRHVPLSTHEIVDDVHAAYEMGITTAHLHVRDQHSQPTLDPEIYARLIDQIRAFAPDLVIYIAQWTRRQKSGGTRTPSKLG